MQLRDNFWRHPPWREGKNKHRLGLRPIEMDAVWVSDDELSANKRKQVRERYPEVVATLPGYEGVALAIPGVDEPLAAYPDWIANVGIEVSEDLCLLDTEQGHRLVACCLAAPSYWSLHDKLGHPLQHVHGPVQGMNQKIGERIDGFLQGLPVGRPFRRENWFVHSEAVYFRPKSTLRTQLNAEPSQWHFRSERQTLIRLDTRFVLFIIGIVFVPVAELAAHPRAVETLLASLKAMDEDEVEHFGGMEKYSRIADYVEQVYKTSVQQF